VLQNFHWLGQVPCQKEAGSPLELAVCVGWVEVHLCLWVSRMSADLVQSHVGKEGIPTCTFDDAWLGVIVLQHYLLYAQDTEHPAGSHL
jgi:hypothetical protein